MVKITRNIIFFDKLTYIHTWSSHFLNLNSISFNFCSYTFFRLKPRFGVLLRFCWNLEHFSPKIDKEHNFFDKLKYIHTWYWHFLKLNSISFNFCSYTFFRLKPRYGVFLNFVEIWTIFSSKIDFDHNFFGTKVVRNWF